MTPDEYIRKVHSGIQQQGCGMSLIIFCLIVMLSLCGCKTKERVVVVTEQHTDTTYITKHQRDSVWLHDSISIREKGDTVWMERWHTKYIEKTATDTLYRSKTDSIPVPYPVEKQLTRWQQIKVGYGGWAMGILAGLIAVFILTSGFWKRIVKVIRYF